MGLRQYHRYSKAVTRTKRWQALRQVALRRDEYKCVKCGEMKRLQVDHIKPVRDAPELSYDLSNLQALCGSCHSKKTRIEVGLAPLNEDRLAWRKLLKQRI